MNRKTVKSGLEQKKALNNSPSKGSFLFFAFAAFVLLSGCSQPEYQQNTAPPKGTQNPFGTGLQMPDDTLLTDIDQIDEIDGGISENDFSGEIQSFEEDVSEAEGFEEEITESENQIDQLEGIDEADFE